MSDNTAILAGFTREVMAASGDGSIDCRLFIKPDTDLDDCFKAYDADNCEWLFIKGWLWTFEAVA